MPTLNWIGKEKVINHHNQVPYKVLNHKFTFYKNKRLDDKVNSENMIIEGDNLEALKSLLPKYESKIDIIYIDPPYNTGKEKWVYNDSVNDPRMKKWLGEVVGNEGEDLSRHDKWLCMMYPRIKLLEKLLSNSGILVIHIDEHAYSILHLLLIEIFGKNNDLGTIIWDKLNPKGDSTRISYQHENILIFSKDHTKVKNKLKRQKANAEAIIKKANILFKKIGKQGYPEDLQKIVKKYKLNKSILEEYSFIYTKDKVETEFQNWLNQQNFSNGEKAYKFIDDNGDVYQSVSMAWPNKKEAPIEYFIPLIHPKTKRECPIPEKGWRNPPQTMAKLNAMNLILYGTDENVQPRRKYLLKDHLEENIPSILSFGGSDDKFQKEIGIKFENPKPHKFSEQILGWFDNDITILDSFAGSGTTAHAVINLNKIDNGTRKFILIEMMNYAKTITAKRVEHVIKSNDLDESFNYYELGQSLFDEFGFLNENVDVQIIKEYIFYSETKSHLENIDDSFYLGENNSIDYYFYYKKDLLTTLNYDFLSLIQKKSNQYVIYADNCLLSIEFMNKHNIIFKKIPRDITRF